MDEFTRGLLKPTTTEEQYVSYEQPILVVICQVVGVLSFLAGLIVPFVTGMQQNLPVVGVSILGGAASAIVYFGIAQLVDLLGKIEYNSRSLPRIEKQFERLERA
jgi:hypothetical protein